MFEAVQHVVLVDNESDDGTPEVARQVAESVGAADRFTLASYPFRVARAGAEHLATPPDSVHSLTYFYNWSFSHVRTSYSMKWDGDMVLTREGVEVLRDLSWQLEELQCGRRDPEAPDVGGERARGLAGPRLPVPGAVGLPDGPEFTFVKAFEWEVREFPATSERIVVPEGLCVELKWLDQDEFAHWSSTDFDAIRTPRKRREWEVYTALKEGRGESVPASSASSRRRGCTSSTTSPRPGCRGPRGRWRGGTWWRTPARWAESAVECGPRPDGVVIRPTEVEPGRYDEVLVLVRDRAECGRSPAQGRPDADLGVRVEEGTSPLSLAPRPEWPALHDRTRGRRRLADRAPVRDPGPGTRGGSRARPAVGVAGPGG